MNINNSSTISYTGLSRGLSKQVFSKGSISILDRLNPKSNGIVGNLPACWITHMPVANREENIKGLFNALGDFFSQRLYWMRNQEKASEMLTEILHKHNALEKDAVVELSKLDCGEFGQGYKIQNKKDKSALFVKLFYKGNESACKEYSEHGVLPEINANMFLQRNFKAAAEKKCFPKFYYGDIRSNYYVEEFVEPETVVSCQDIPFVERHQVLKKVRKMFKVHNLIHTDLFDRNVVYYYDKNNKLQVICYDLGGVKEYKEVSNWRNILG